MSLYPGGYIVIYKAPISSKRAWDVMSLEDWANMTSEDRNRIAQDQRYGVRRRADKGSGDGSGPAFPA